MHLKQQNNLLINKNLNDKTFTKRQVLVPYPFIMYWVTKNGITKKNASQILHSDLL